MLNIVSIFDQAHVFEPNCDRDYSKNVLKENNLRKHEIENRCINIFGFLFALRAELIKTACEPNSFVVENYRR